MCLYTQIWAQDVFDALGPGYWFATSTSSPAGFVCILTACAFV